MRARFGCSELERSKSARKSNRKTTKTGVKTNTIPKAIALMSYLPVRKSRKTPKGTVTIRSNSLKRSIQKTEREKEKREKRKGKQT